MTHLRTSAVVFALLAVAHSDLWVFRSLFTLAAGLSLLAAAWRDTPKEWSAK